MHRRQFLALVSVSSVGLSGCLGGGLAEDALVRAVQESAPESDVDVRYEELPPAEQEIARTAVEEPYYHACPDLPDALRSFAQRFRSERAFLEYQNETYALWIRIQDVVSASTADPPEDDPGCGLL